MSVEMQPSDITQADRQEIERSVERWIQLSLDRDFEKLIDELCTSDVTLLPPDHPACLGAAESLAYLNEYPEIESFEASVETVHGRGDTAIARGTVDITVKDDGQSINAIGKWLAGYRKTTDGWKVTHDMWNNDAPMS
jgi:ketosteroid isomerase-like protein